MRTYTSTEMTNGESAAGRMSEKAYKAYCETDPCRLFERELIDENGETTKVYDLQVADDKLEGLTFKEAEETLESWAEW